MYTCIGEGLVRRKGVGPGKTSKSQETGKEREEMGTVGGERQGAGDVG